MNKLPSPHTLSVGWYLIELRDDLPQQSVQHRQLSAEVDVALEARRVGQSLWVGDLRQETHHSRPLVLQEVIHEGHVLLFVSKPVEDTNASELRFKQPQCDSSCFQLTHRHSLGEVGEVLDDLGDERQRPGRPVVGVFLHQVEERGRHDGGAEEAQEQRGAYQTLADVLLVAASDALLLPRREHLLQLPRKHTEERREVRGHVLTVSQTHNKHFSIIHIR